MSDIYKKWLEESKEETAAWKKEADQRLWYWKDEIGKTKQLQQQVDKWKEMAHDMYIWLDAYMHTRPTIDKSHPVHGLIQQYEELEKQQP